MSDGLSPRDRPDLKLFGILLAIDAVFVAIYIVHAQTTLLPSNMFSIANDGSYSEWFQYLKEFSVVVMLAWLASRRERSRILLAVLAALYLYLCLDDSLEIHELAGHALALGFGLNPVDASPAQDFGEIAVSAIAGLFFLGMGLLGYRRADRRERAIARWFLVLTVLLAGVGMGVDIIHARSFPRWFRGILNIMEDGGEMVVMSATVAFARGLVRAESGEAGAQNRRR